MPNPVLLAVNRSEEIDIQQLATPSGESTLVCELTIKNAALPDVLWILDGQHRVEGLANTKRNLNPIPVVILYDPLLRAYPKPDFARVFSEVSTQATPLNPIHKEWLEYVYKLGGFGNITNGPALRAAMETVAHLCRESTFGTHPATTSNMFHNKIKFNPEFDPQPVYHHGFSFTSSEYLSQIYTHYYKTGSLSSRDKPLALAEQINLAMQNLVSIATTPKDDSVLFGIEDKRRKAMEIGMLIGILVKLTTNRAPPWKSIFLNLGFGTVDWDFKKWIRTTSGTAGTTSNRVAKEVLIKSLIDERFPGTPQPNLTDYLQGDGGEVEFSAFDISNRSGRALPKSKAPFKYLTNRKLTFDTKKSGKAIIKITARTSNVGDIKTHILSSPFDKTYHYKNFKKGVELTTGQYQIQIAAEFFGEVSSIGQITLVIH
jgi:hypothetical protein